MLSVPYRLLVVTVSSMVLGTGKKGSPGENDEGERSFHADRPLAA